MKATFATAALIALSACTSTDIVASGKTTRFELHSSRFFQQTALTYDPATGALTYSSDPQAQQATELLKAGVALGAGIAAKAATGGVAP